MESEQRGSYKNPREIAIDSYAKQQREFHYCAIEILIKELKESIYNKILIS
jgi:hypothetical protein